MEGWNHLEFSHVAILCSGGTKLIHFNYCHQSVSFDPVTFETR